MNHNPARPGGLSEAEQRAKWEAHLRGRGWNGRKRNIYTCGECFGHIVTEDVEEGATPFMLPCLATRGCDGSMESSMYRVFDQRLKADFEWRKPNALELGALSPEEIEHVGKGGLLLHPLTDQARAAEADHRRRVEAFREGQGGAAD